jgi:hypothetical protein
MKYMQHIVQNVLQMPKYESNINEIYATYSSKCFANA